MNAGAKEMMTPSDVIAAADITFSCVSDPQVAKNVSLQINKVKYFFTSLTKTKFIHFGNSCSRSFILFTEWISSFYICLYHIVFHC